MVHALVVENADPIMREQIEQCFEPSGHEIRALLDASYKRSTWGRRPEDVVAQQAIMGEIGQR